MFEGNERFEIRGRLGQGGMGIVYRALDRERQKEVALKTLVQANEELIFRMKLEFRSLAGIVHPNLVTLHELFYAGDQWFFTMDLVEGTDFLNYTRNDLEHASNDAESDAMAGSSLPLTVPVGADVKQSHPPGDSSIERTTVGGALAAETVATGADSQTLVPDSIAKTLLPDSIANTLLPDSIAKTLLPDSIAKTLLPDSNADPLLSDSNADPLLSDSWTPAPPWDIDTQVGTEVDEPPMLSFDSERLRSALGQMAKGVCALHEVGKLHRDLKPANVQVRPDGRVVLLDFGLAVDRHPDPLLGRDTEQDGAGTPQYMSPEQAAGLPITEASDWYAVGGMLYEALTGRVPYETARQRNAGNPTPPTVLNSEAPQDLNDLCLALLDKDPSKRPNGEDIRRVANAQIGVLSLVGMRPMGAPASVSERSFLGRDKQLEALSSALQSTRDDRSLVWVDVPGVSGVGKTALVRHFLADVSQTEQAVVLAGGCYERESVPYKVFDTIIDSLGVYLRSLPRTQAEGLMPRDVRVLARLFPTFLRVPAVKDAPRYDADASDPQELFTRASAALRELLGRIAKRHPLIVFVDDLQWGDTDSVRLLEDLVVHQDRPHLLFIASYRSHELNSNEGLQRLLEVPAAAADAVNRQVVEVGPLEKADALELALRLLGGRGPAAVAKATAIVGDAEGSPLFISELASHAARTESQDHVSLEGVLHERIARLPKRAARLLNVIAVAGRPEPQILVSKAAGLGAQAQEMLALLRSTNLISTTGMGREDCVGILHNRIREMLFKRITGKPLREYHRRLASALEEVELPNAEALTLHWQGAGQPERAARYALLAAGQADEAFAFDHAAKLYALAIGLSAEAEAIPQAPGPLRAADVSRACFMETHLGDALTNAGRGQEAAQAYLRASKVASSDLGLGLQRKAAERLLVSGHIKEGLEQAQNILRIVGVRFPATPFRAVLSMLYQRFRLWMRGTKFNERIESEIDPAVLTRVDMCSSMAVGLTMADMMRGMDFTTRAFLLALDSGEPRRIARLMTYEAGHVGGLRPWGSRAPRLLQDANALAGRSKDPLATGLVLLFTGMNAFSRGAWRETQSNCEKASKIFREGCTDVFWEISTSAQFQIWALFYLGDIIEFESRASRLLKDARHRDNLYVSFTLRTGLCVTRHLMHDDVIEARSQLDAAAQEWSNEGFQFQDFLLLLGRGLIDHYAGHGPSSWLRIEKSWRALKGSFLLKSPIIVFMMLHLRANAALACGADAKLMRRARKDARTLARSKMSGAGGLAALIEGGIASREGAKPLAIAYFARAVEAFGKHEMSLLAQVARLRLGELVGGDEGSAMVASATEWMRQQNISNPLRMAAMLAPPHLIG